MFSFLILTDPVTWCCHLILKQISFVTGVALAVSLFLGFGAFSSLFTTDSEVLEIVQSGTLVRSYLHSFPAFTTYNITDRLWSMNVLL